MGKSIYSDASCEINSAKLELTVLSQKTDLILDMNYIAKCLFLNIPSV